MSGEIKAALEPDGRSVRLERDEHVSSTLWLSLARNIAPGNFQEESEHAVLLPVERFLGSRNWLAQALTRYDCSIMCEPQVLELLTREDAERQEVQALLRHGIAPVRGLDARLGDGRFLRELKTFQRRDLAHLLGLSNGANFSVPGAGKTTVAYATYEAERLAGRVEQLLVVAPLSAFESWITEAGRCFSPEPVVRRWGDRGALRAEVMLINYQRLAAAFEDLASFCHARPTHILLDEAHRMKRGRAGEWGSYCLDLAFLGARRDILTGTPAPQHPNDLRALLEFVWPHQSENIMPAESRRPAPTPQVLTQTSQRLRPLFVRTTKNELGLPPTKLRVELVPMNTVQASIYDALRTRMRHTLAESARERSTLARMSEVVMYLLEAASNPALLAPALGRPPANHATWPLLPVPQGSSLSDKILRYSEHEIPRKFEKLATMVSANTSLGRKTLVWSNFVGNLELLRSQILLPYRPAMIHGGVPSLSDQDALVSRERELKRFREDDDCTVLLANPAAMSEGVSLHDVCHDAVYVDRTFNAGQYLQSIDRIHRLGLPADAETRITFLVSVGTVDEVVDTRVRTKAERLAAMLSDADLVEMALPDEDAYGEWVDDEDLDALFSHLRRVT